MTLAPKDYISARRKELLEQIEGLKQQLADLDAMESVLQPKRLRLELALEDEPENALALTPATRQRFGKTIKQMVLEALENSTGLLALEILGALKARFGAEIERTTLSPQLSRLKADGHINAFENRWQITQEGRRFLGALKFGQKN